MNLTICPDCGATAGEIVPHCQYCGCMELQHFADIKEGESIYACGNCRNTYYMLEKDSPELHQIHYATILGGLGNLEHLPLSTCNTVFRCEKCKQWNWVTFDERIAAVAFPCSECGSHTRFDTFGRKIVFSKEMWRRFVLGDLRLAGKHLTLKCGHNVYLPKTLVERVVRKK
jgi:hypothetical protein